MQYFLVLALTTIRGVLGHGFFARRSGAELNVMAIHDHMARDGEHDHSSSLQKRTNCGLGVGSCPQGLCCSGAGWCGNSPDHCNSPQCQPEYGSCGAGSGEAPPNGQAPPAGGSAGGKPQGESTVNIPRDNSGSVPYNVYITTCTQKGVVALTFDDGPYTYTEHVLNVLDEYEAKATFFIVGNNLGRGSIDDESTEWPELLRRMHTSGHQLASHSWSHQDLTLASQPVREEEIIWNEMAFRNVFGWFPKYFRPPFATCSGESGCLDYLTRMGYHVVNFDIDTKDYMHNTPETIQTSKDVFSDALSPDAASNGYIELCHDIHFQTAHNLTDFMLRTVKERGYKAVTVGECLGDSPDNWYVQA